MSVASPSLKERLQAVKKTRWIRFGVAAVLFILFAVWLDNYYILPFLVVMADIYLTRYVPWTFWKNPRTKPYYGSWSGSMPSFMLWWRYI